MNRFGNTLTRAGGILLLAAGALFISPPAMAEDAAATAVSPLAAWPMAQRANVQRRKPAPRPQRPITFQCAVEELEEGIASFGGPNWPDGIVPFEFDPTITADEQDDTLAAMDWWTTTTGVKFVYRQSQPNFLFITRSPEANVSSAPVGMGAGPRNVRIGSNVWGEHGVIAHELCHALGFQHEQSRPDRDQFVTIESQNVPPARSHNFVQADGSQMFTPYDYGSIMHYQACAFSSCNDCLADDPNCRTITTLDPDWQSEIGQVDELSDFDILDMQAVYGPRDSRYVRGDNPFGLFGGGTLSNPIPFIRLALGGIPAGGTLLLDGSAGPYSEPGSFSKRSVWRAHRASVEIGAGQ